MEYDEITPELPKNLDEVDVSDSTANKHRKTFTQPLDTEKRQVVLVSGSSRGLGLAIAERYLQEGACVTITGSGQDSVDQAMKDLGQKFDDSLMFPFIGDLTRKEVIQSFVDALITRFGQVDIAICNLGGGSGLRGVGIPEEEWSRLFDLNFHASRRLTEVLVERGCLRSSLIFISSIAGCESLGAPIPYEVAKAALKFYAKAISIELAAQNIRVNVICPGNILAKGGTWEKILEENPDAVKKMLKEKVSMKRLANPREIANVVFFVASEENSFMTGSNIIVDGGQLRFI